jgi:hypothetical protein
MAANKGTKKLKKARALRHTKPLTIYQSIKN